MLVFGLNGISKQIGLMPTFVSGRPQFRCLCSELVLFKTEVKSGWVCVFAWKLYKEPKTHSQVYRRCFLQDELKSLASEKCIKMYSSISAQGHFFEEVLSTDMVEFGHDPSFPSTFKIFPPHSRKELAHDVFLGYFLVS